MPPSSNPASPSPGDNASSRSAEGVPTIIDTLAAACAEAGDFDQAMRRQGQAIELLTDAKKKEDYATRLKLYRERKPYREASP